MTTARPPSPEYYRHRIRTWTGAVDEQCRFNVVEGDVPPFVAGDNLIEVGEMWLRRQAIPRDALVDNGR